MSRPDAADSTSRAWWGGFALVLLFSAGHGAVTTLLWFSFPTAPGGSYYPWLASFGLERLGLMIVTLLAVLAARAPLSDFGIVRWQWRQLGIGAGTALAALALNGVMAMILGFTKATFGPPLWPISSTGLPLEGYLIFVLSVSIGVATEELVFRGFLLTRLTELYSWRPLAVIAAAMLHALMYLSYGGISVAIVFTIGLVHGLAFLKWRCLWIPVVSGLILQLIVFDGRYSGPIAQMIMEAR